MNYMNYYSNPNNAIPSFPPPPPGVAPYSSYPQSFTTLTTPILASSNIPPHSQATSYGNVYSAAALPQQQVYSSASTNISWQRQQAPVSTSSFTAIVSPQPAISNVQKQSEPKWNLEDALKAAAVKVLQGPSTVATMATYASQTTPAAATAFMPQSAPLSTTGQKPTYSQPSASNVQWQRPQGNQHYCELCKVSCATTSAYQNHLQGQKHQKKEAHQKMSATATAGSWPYPTVSLSTTPSSSARHYRCELCSISCTGIETYQAHLNGKPHKKTLMLHQRMGKAVPPNMEPFPTATPDPPIPASTTAATKRPADGAGGSGGGGWKKGGSNKKSRMFGPSGGMMNMQPPPRPVILGDISKAVLYQDSQVVSQMEKSLSSRHGNIVLPEKRLHALMEFWSMCERAIRLTQMEIDLEGKVRTATAGVNTAQSSMSNLSPTNQMIVESVRVGCGSRRLLLQTDVVVQLVLMLAKWPTMRILTLLADRLTTHLQAASNPKTVVRVEPCGILVVQTVPKEGDTNTDSLECHILPTWKQLLQGNESEKEVKDMEEDALDEVSCVRAVQLVRENYWFQKTLSMNAPCLVVLRVFRHLVSREIVWSGLSDRLLELLVDRACRSWMGPMTVSTIFRRVLECLASGVVLPKGPGLVEPCGKGERQDATAALTPQQREDITASAQRVIRLLAFGMIDKVLGVDPVAVEKSSVSATESGGQDPIQESTTEQKL